MSSASGQDIPLVDNTLSVLLFVLGFVATGIVGVAAGYEALALLVLIPSLVVFVPRLAIFALNAPLALLDTAGTAIAVALYDAIATMGFNVWNWLTRTPLGRSWNLVAMKPFRPRPHIADGVRLFGKTP